MKAGATVQWPSAGDSPRPRTARWRSGIGRKIPVPAASVHNDLGLSVHHAASKPMTPCKDRCREGVQLSDAIGSDDGDGHHKCKTAFDLAGAGTRHRKCATPFGHLFCRAASRRNRRCVRGHGTPCTLLDSLRRLSVHSNVSSYFRIN